MGYKIDMDTLWELIYPPISECIICKAPFVRPTPFCICPFCDEQMDYIKKGRWLQSAPLHQQQSIQMFSVLPYGGHMVPLIYRFKYHQETYLARIFGKLLAAFVIREALEFDLLCPVPLHKKRAKNRGFNQSALLVKYMARECVCEYDTNNLIRIKETAAMHQLSKYERGQNVQDAFALKNPQKIIDRKVLLIDDILTTGATAEACGKVLFQGGARSVTLLTLTHRPKFND